MSGPHFQADNTVKNNADKAKETVGKLPWWYGSKLLPDKEKACIRHRQNPLIAKPHICRFADGEYSTAVLQATEH